MVIAMEDYYFDKETTLAAWIRLLSVFGRFYSVSDVMYGDGRKIYHPINWDGYPGPEDVYPRESYRLGTDPFIRLRNGVD